ncbi:hypothetical protein [Bradyrhizobium sp. Leo170]|uniref:hypothetical protein n=1 Tax=Bradyrhizobium sp. Leo170 TaxID=1571199 RepID=UPI00102E9D3D|nr:hypothetical protein [Bradyrhizobium sp. Leo170]TAI65150.1 hypothetical protein CWO89_15095 [Bradyrhizobium sp. Leo170]
MIGLFCFVLAVLASPFKSKLRLEAENALLRHQLIVLRRRLYGRVRLTKQDRWFFVQMYRWFPSILQVLTIIRPETLVRWHRVGLRCYWRWKSRPLGGRPQIDTELRALIRRMSGDYNEMRTHLALDKDAPVSRPVERNGVVRSRAILGGLHHHYART